jgi:hypothetical protein
MPKYVTFDEAGVYVEAAGYSADPPAGALILANQFDLKIAQLSYMVDGDLTPRPAPPDLQISGDDYSFIGCETGTKIIVADASGDEVMADVVTPEEDPDVTFTLTSPGLYQIEIIPPLPGYPVEHSVEIPDAT